MATSAASRKAPSLVVAASLGAVEALKDQAGLCRWGYALRRAAPSVRALTASLSETAAAAGASRPASSSSAMAAEDVRLHKAHHLVCWGPN